MDSSGDSAAFGRAGQTGQVGDAMVGAVGGAAPEPVGEPATTEDGHAPTTGTDAAADTPATPDDAPVPGTTADADGTPPATTDDAPAPGTGTDDAAAASAPSTDHAAPPTDDIAPVTTDVAPTPAPSTHHAAPATDDVAPAPASPGAPTPTPTPADGGASAGDHATAAAFGRVDTDGTVYLRTAAGERVVGSWQAGSPEEGLAHFARRYADLATEVRLLEARVASGATDAQHARTSVTRLLESLPGAAVVGDVDALARRLEALAGVTAGKAEEERAARVQAREEAAARKRALLEEIEGLAANSTQWKATGDRFREALEEWKTIRGIDRKTDGELWKRYAAARDAFSRRRGTHFAGLDSQRKQIQTAKEELVTEAATLSESTDWGGAATRLKQLMADWKALGRAPREAEEQLWKRFRAAQDAFFARRSEVFSERDAELRVNQRAKEELLTEAERIDVSGDLRAAQAALRDVQTRWDAVGRVPREAIAPLDRRLRAVEERVRGAADTQWRRGSSESPLLGQMREQVAKAERQLERAQAAGDRRRIVEAEQALASKRQFLQLAERTS